MNLLVSSPGSAAAADSGSKYLCATPPSSQRRHLRTCVLRASASAQRSVSLCEPLPARAVAAQRVAHWRAARQRPAQCVVARAAAGATVVVPHAVSCVQRASPWWSVSQCNLLLAMPRLPGVQCTDVQRTCEQCSVSLHELLLLLLQRAVTPRAARGAEWRHGFAPRAGGGRHGGQRHCRVSLPHCQDGAGSGLLCENTEAQLRINRPILLLPLNN